MTGSTAADGALQLPARSVAIAVKFCCPSLNGAVVKLHSPPALHSAVPSATALSNTVTVALASAVPLSVTESSPLIMSLATTGAFGAMLSKMKLSEAEPVSPTVLVSLTVTVCKPCDRAVGVNDQSPLAFVIVVPRTVDPSVRVTVALASAVPVRASLAVTSLPPLVSMAKAMVSAGAAVAPAGFQPNRFISVRSLAETPLTTPGLENAKNESLPALPAQSPKSPPALVLKLLRLVTPPFGEKYPGVVP